MEITISDIIKILFTSSLIDLAVVNRYLSIFIRKAKEKWFCLECYFYYLHCILMISECEQGFEILEWWIFWKKKMVDFLFLYFVSQDQLYTGDSWWSQGCEKFEICKWWSIANVRVSILLPDRWFSLVFFFKICFFPFAD